MEEKYCSCEEPEIVIDYGEFIQTDLRIGKDGKYYYARAYRTEPTRPYCGLCNRLIREEVLKLYAPEEIG